jgi:hypothetical protein
MKIRLWSALLSMAALAAVALSVTTTAGQTAAGQAGATKTKPIPRLADGKPDFNGVWDRPRIVDITQNGNGCGSGAPTTGCRQTGSGALTYTAWGQEQWLGAKYDYAAYCLPWGYTRAMQTAYPLEIVQTPNRTAYLFESNNVFHVIPTDGRKMPKDIEPTWMGISVGRYEGDTLIIETAGFNGLTWIDTAQHPSSDQLRVTERLRHIDADHLEYEVTWDDPKTYAKPFKNTRIWARMAPGSELMEWWCMENNKSLLEGRITDIPKK